MLTNRAVSRNKAVKLSWHITALLGDPYCKDKHQTTNSKQINYPLDPEPVWNVTADVFVIKNKINANEVLHSGVDDYPLDPEPVWSVTADVFVIKNKKTNEHRI